MSKGYSLQVAQRKASTFNDFFNLFFFFFDELAMETARPPADLVVLYTPFLRQPLWVVDIILHFFHLGDDIHFLI